MYYILRPIVREGTIMLDLVSHWEYSLSLAERLPKDIPEPIEFKIDTSFNSSYLPTTFLPEPVFSIDFIDALRNCGVDNIDTYDVKIVAPDSTNVISGYKAVNIIGKISCANMEFSKSNYIIEDQSSFEKLVIDASKNTGNYLFRLAECTQLILIHEHVVNNLPSEFTKDIYFEPVEEI